LTVARGWVVAGKPSNDVRSDNYASWVGGLRGMLGWAGFTGTFGGGNTETAVSADDEEWHHSLVALHSSFGTEPFTVKDLVARLEFVGAPLFDAAALPGIWPIDGRTSTTGRMPGSGSRWANGSRTA
jgi:hypothetical protein